MNATDFNILAKKIIVGIFIFVIPLLVIAGGLWLTNHLLKSNKRTQTELNTPEL
jgi:hypothetical protein